MKKTFNFYILFSTRDETNIRYVGVTSRTINQRFYGHKYCCMHLEKRALPVHKWMYSEIQNGFEIKYKQIDSCIESLWEEKEKYWIKYYQKLGFKLLNISEGGKGVITKEMRSKPSIQRSIDAHKKPILALDEDMKVKYKFNSIVEASNFFHKNSHSAIGNALSKTTKTKKSCGYFWVYKEDYDAGIINVDTSINGISKMKHLYRFDLNGNFIKDYISINDFLRQENLTNGSAVTKAANNKTAYLDSFWSWTKENTFDYDSVFKYYEVDKYNNIIHKFKNLQEISNIYKKNTSCICVYISSRKILENGNKIIKKENYK